MTIIYFILILGIVVTIHEFGHFLFAKKAGVYVYEFSIGMGPKLFGFSRKNDETKYVIRLLPIGGYVQMAGEEVEADKNIPEEKRMQSKSWIKRFLIVVAGILFNFLLAIVVFFIIGLVNGSPVNKPYVTDIKENTAAYDAGMRNDDLIISINGTKIRNTDRLLIEMQVHLGETITFEVKDTNENIKKVTITPEKVTEDRKDSYVYGISFRKDIKTGFLEALKYAFVNFINLVCEMFITIWYLITGKLSLSNLSGPIGIFNVVDSSAKSGFINVVYLMGYISLNVGFMNLLPIPALDGGRLLFLIIEKIIGKPVSPKVENTIHNIGFILLLVLIVFVSYGDIMRLIKG